MSRDFDPFSGGDLIAFSAGALATIAGGPFSIAVLHRPVSQFCGMHHAEKTAATQYELWGEGGSGIFTLPGGFGAGPAITINQWQLTGASKAAGSVTGRYHLVPLEGGSAGVWNHINAVGGTWNDWALGIDKLVIGTGQRKGAGQIAAVAVWPFNFTDSDWVNLIGFTQAQAWFNQHPSAMWLLNQASTATPVQDVTGNGANQTSLTGTTVSGLEPPGWSYSLTSHAKGAEFLSFF